VTEDRSHFRAVVKYAVIGVEICSVRVIEDEVQFDAFVKRL
jgi:hypothetical protein